MPRMCGFAKHPLKNGVLVTDPKRISFVHKSRPDFRPADEVCIICRNSMEYMYRLKMQHARELQKSRNSKVSTISSNSADSIDSIDMLVLQTPEHKKSREKETDSLQSISTDQSVLVRYGGPTTESPIATNEESENRSKKSATNILLESRRQPLNDSHKKPGRESNNKTSTDILQETRRKSLSITSTESGNSSLVTVIRKEVTSNSVVPIPEKISSRVEIINGDSNNIHLSQEPSTTAAAAKSKGTVQKQRTAVQNVTPTSTNCDNLNIRLSQKPSTSAAAAKAKGIVQKQRPAVLIVTPKSTDRDSPNIRLAQEPTTSAAAAGITDIRDYFPALEVNGTSINNLHTSAVRSSGSSSSESPTALSITGRTDQASTSSRKRPLNGNVDINGDTNGDSDDDEPRMSLNYYNPEVRFPQYQPIPKRRKFQHKNDKVMDMYIQGLNGG